MVRRMFWKEQPKRVIVSYLKIMYDPCTFPK